VKRVIDTLFRGIVDNLENRRTKMVLAQTKGRLVDIGCGENRLVRQYGNGVGVDVYDWGDVDAVVADTADLPFPDGSFDTASFVACLNHIPNRLEVLKEARRCLTNDGRVVVTMISPTISVVWHRIIRRWDADQTERGMKSGEVWGLTPRQVYALLEGAGFRIIRHKRFVFWLNHLYVGAKSETA
jgi:SAM-dependent methyltransferase